MARHPSEWVQAAEPKRAIAEALTLLERIAEALEQLVELERTEPLERIIHPSFLREELPITGEEE